MDFIYIGFSEEMIENTLHSEALNLVGIITRRSKLSEGILNRLQKQEIKIYYADSKKDLSGIFEECGNLLYVMYVFNLIIPQEIAEKYRILNIHPGDLRDNRGKNPVSWNILQGDPFVTVSLHKIDGQIDRGFLIEEFKIPILESDDYLTLNKKIAECWPALEEVILEYMAGKRDGIPVKEGIYRRAIQENDYTIHLSEDSKEMMINKIKSQRGYKGAIIKVGDLNLYVTDWSEGGG